MKDNNIAIVVNSFDGYQDLWDVFWDIFDRYGSDCPFPKYLISNEIDYLRDGDINIKVGKETNWVERTQKAIKDIKEDYIVMFLEDYFPSKRIDFTEIRSIVERMQREDIFFYRLSMRKELPQNQSFVEMPEGSDYPITLQLAIWDKNMLSTIVNELNENGCESPWDFEFQLKNDYKYCPPINGKLSRIRFDTRDILGYKNGVLRGKWFPDVRQYYIRQGIDFSKSQRPIMNRGQYIKYKMVRFISESFSKEEKEKIKNVIKKFKIKDSL